MPRKRLSIEEKKARGTYRPSQERYYALAEGREDPTAPQPVPKVQDPAPVRDYAGICQAYIDGVLDGVIVACRWLKLACLRQQRDLGREREPAWPFVWSQVEADKACHFVECCPHVEGSWASATITLEPWQVFLVSLLFGWRYKAARQRRRFTSFYLEVARKSAKSTLMAAIAYYHLLREGELGASVICGATTGQQARMVFGIMQAMGRRSNWLRAQGVEVFSNSIACPSGSARPVNSKASSLDGLNPSCIVLDESHAQDFGLHDVLRSAQGARANPLMLCPTTAGYNLLSVGYALRTQLTKVLEEVFQADHLLGVIYTVDVEDEWWDPAVWIKANPMIGISPTWDYVRRYCADARQAPGLEGEFRVKVCSLWAQSASSWLSMTAWDRCAEPELSEEAFAGEPCWVGGDLAAVDDLASICRVYKRKRSRHDLHLALLPSEGGGKLGELVEEIAALAGAKPKAEPYDLVAFWTSYLPEEVIEERARAVPAYREWVEAGILVPTEGSMTDIARIEADIEALALEVHVQAVVFDQYGSAQSASRLAAKGIPASVEPKNAKTTTGPAREIEARVKHGRFRHNGDPHAKWAASNAVVVRRTDDSILPKKESPESPNKIDPIDALVSAVGAALRGGPTAEPDYQVVIVGGKKS